MADLKYPVAYLENEDFDSDGNLHKNLHKKIPIVVFIQASWCPHCTNAKSSFQNFANMNKDKVFCATIQVDGERSSEVELGKKINKIKPEFRGFPDYILIIDGKVVSKEINGRDVSDLEEFVYL